MHLKRNIRDTKELIILTKNNYYILLKQKKIQIVCISPRENETKNKLLTLNSNIFY